MENSDWYELGMQDPVIMSGKRYEVPVLVKVNRTPEERAMFQQKLAEYEHRAAETKE